MIVSPSQGLASFPDTCINPMQGLKIPISPAAFPCALGSVLPNFTTFLRLFRLDRASLCLRRSGQADPFQLGQLLLDSIAEVLLLLAPMGFDPPQHFWRKDFSPAKRSPLDGWAQ